LFLATGALGFKSGSQGVKCHISIKDYGK